MYPLNPALWKKCRHNLINLVVVPPCRHRKNEPIRRTQILRFFELLLVKRWVDFLSIRRYCTTCKILNFFFVCRQTKPCEALTTNDVHLRQICRCLSTHSDNATLVPPSPSVPPTSSLGRTRSGIKMIYIIVRGYPPPPSKAIFLVL